MATPTLNTDASTKLYVDNAISGISGGVPIGTVVMWCTATIPTNWLLLDGSTYNTTTYATLFALLGSGTLPNMRGRAPRGYDSPRLIDQTVRNLLSTQEDMIVKHSHLVPDQVFSTDDGGEHNHSVSYVNSNSGANVRASESSSN